LSPEHGCTTSWAKAVLHACKKSTPSSDSLQFAVTKGCLQRGGHRRHKSQIRQRRLNMTPHVKSRIEDEVRRIATDLNLSDAQKAQMRAALENAEGKLDTDSPGRVRDAIREQVTKILTPQQLTKWDAEMAKAKTFLGRELRP
jgi:protein CpxP